MFKPINNFNQSPTFSTLRRTHPLSLPSLNQKLLRLSPCSDDLDFDLNPLFSLFLRQPEHLQMFDHILLRDGAISLIEFFLRFPSPPANPPRVSVDRDLAFIVPKTWQTYTSTYSLERVPSEKPFISPKKFRSILFYGLLNPSGINWSYLESNLEKWLTQFSPESDIHCAFFHREEFHEKPWKEPKETWTFLARLQKYFQPPLQFIGQDELFTLKNHSDLLFVPLDFLKLNVGLSAVQFAFHSSRAALYSPLTTHSSPLKSTTLKTLSMAPNVNMHLEKINATSEFLSLQKLQLRSPVQSQASTLVKNHLEMYLSSKLGF